MSASIRVMGFLLIVTMVLVQQVAAEVREWSPESGNELRAEIVKVQGGRVWLKRTDGRTINIGISKLSEADREFIVEFNAKRNGAQDKSAWYKEIGGIGRSSALLGEYLIRGGETRDFTVTAAKKAVLFVGVRVKESGALEASHNADTGAIELSSHLAPHDPLMTNHGVGMEFQLKNGNVRFTSKNHSKVDTRIAIFTRKSQSAGVKFQLLKPGVSAPRHSDLDPRLAKMKVVYQSKSDAIYADFHKSVDSGGLIGKASSQKTAAFTDLTRRYAVALDRLAKSAPSLKEEIQIEKARIADHLEDVKTHRDLRKRAKRKKK